MKAPHHRPPRRPRAVIDRRTPLQIAAAHADALLDRAMLRAEALTEPAIGEVCGAPAGEFALPAVDEVAEQRALFAASIARAEFGRFYWSDKAGRRRKPKRRAAKNGRGAA